MERTFFVTESQAHHWPPERVFLSWLRAGADVLQPWSLGALLVDPACCHRTCSAPLAQGMWDCSLAPEATDPTSLAVSHDSCPTSLEAPGTYYGGRWVFPARLSYSQRAELLLQSEGLWFGSMEAATGADPRTLRHRGLSQALPCGSWADAAASSWRGLRRCMVSNAVITTISCCWL